MWEERFAKKGYLFGTEPVPFLLKHDACFQKGQSVLSIAEGEGRNGVHLAKKGLHVTGVEFAPSAIAKAKKLAELNEVDVTFVGSDLFEWNWPQDAFDITLGLFFQFVGPEGRDTLWRKMLDATRPGGLIMIHGYTPKQLEFGTGGPSNAANLYSKADFDSVFEECDVLINEEYEAEQRSGSAHVGMSALIDFIARKPTA
ncbi:class I SAM-dependent methyltransferase [Aliiroseovarius lamellibrachiae]|uniref:class I SAM-dependent methyltransferase n=1 Tax=Aliiroseovarius lamellibrachiae TaxID=1924933 RepID=UPI001BDFA33A|nr:class I SAM-dependent methyltransferase [Aliiroseovarius lamellibrachiae]MBT2130011.1 class I SAM-dependent methyltransferase [Aliiroseovarius lamellibrachiae]